MFDNIRFIHCSDIHLGANPYGIDERFLDMGKAFSQVVEAAILGNVDFLLIAGDFFHKRSVDARTLEQAVRLLEPLKEKGIPVYMTEGNHDMSTYTTVYSWLDFLSKKGYVHLLKPKMITESKYTLEGAVIEGLDFFIIGLGYPGATASHLIDKLVSIYPDDKGKIVISMLHAGIDKFVTEGMGGLREEEIESLISKSDYIALGHIHGRYEKPDKKYFNPGSIENVKIESAIRNSDIFNRGFYDVCIDRNSKKINYKFINTKVRNSIDPDVDISSCETKDDIPDFVVRYLKENLESSEHAILLQVRLKGILENGSTVVDILEISKAIKENIDVIHVEVLNMLSSQKTNEMQLDSSLSREEIDKEVISKLIKEEGFREEYLGKLLNIVLTMKEIAREGQLTLDKIEGQDIKRMLEDLV